MPAEPDHLDARRHLLLIPYLWNGFPKAMRVLFLAQHGRCPYCGATLPRSIPRNARNTSKTTFDHVFPASSTGRYRPHNKLLAHSICNTRKSDRQPTACERLFLDITNSIVLDLQGQQFDDPKI